MRTSGLSVLLLALICFGASASTVYDITPFSPCGGCSAESFGISNNGLATGSAGNDGFLYDGTNARVIALPGDPTGGGGFAKASEDGLVPAFVSAGDGTTHSFVYQTNGNFSPLPDYPAALATYVMQLSGNDFAGFYSTNLVNYQGFFYRNGVFQSLSDPSRTDGTTFILDMNTAGTLVGFSEDSQGTNTRGVLRRAGCGSIEEFNVPGALESAPVGINDAGEIVGTYRDATGWHGFIYDGVTFQTLDGLGSATILTDINDRGTLLGYTSTESPDAGVFSPFLATPVPEPGSGVGGALTLLVAVLAKEGRRPRHIL